MRLGGWVELEFVDFFKMVCWLDFMMSYLRENYLLYFVNGKFVIVVLIER